MNAIRVDVTKMPSCDTKQMYKILLQSAAEFFTNPQVQEDFERWDRERKQTAMYSNDDSTVCGMALTEGSN